MKEEIWQELVTLDYVLIWRYTDDYEGDLNRYNLLSKQYDKLCERENKLKSILK